MHKNVKSKIEELKQLSIEVIEGGKDLPSIVLLGADNGVLYRVGDGNNPRNNLLHESNKENFVSLVKNQIKLIEQRDKNKIDSVIILNEVYYVERDKDTESINGRVSEQPDCKEGLLVTIEEEKEINSSFYDIITDKTGNRKVENKKDTKNEISDPIFKKLKEGSNLLGVF